MPSSDKPDKEKLYSTPIATGDQLPWYGIKLFTLRQDEVKLTFDEKGWQSFIPMQKVDFRDKQNHLRHELKPVVRNLIFLKKTESEGDIRRQLYEMPYPMSLITKSPADRTVSEIPARQMEEFQIMCNPDIDHWKTLLEL